MSLMYEGARLCNALNVRSRILKSILSSIGSQCRVCSVGVMLSFFFRQGMSLAALFWTSGIPMRREFSASILHVTNACTSISADAYVMGRRYC